eukprot:scaffold30900_cov68-Cyclotella_meneghiniana.AAC.5
MNNLFGAGRGASISPIDSYVDFGFKSATRQKDRNDKTKKSKIEARGNTNTKAHQSNRANHIINPTPIQEKAILSSSLLGSVFHTNA